MPRKKTTATQKKTARFDGKAYYRKQVDSLHNAGNIAGELAGIACGIYADEYGAECPPDRIPNAAALNDPDFLRNVDADTWTAYGETLAAMPERFDFTRPLPETWLAAWLKHEEHGAFVIEYPARMFSRVCSLSAQEHYFPDIEGDAEAWRARPEGERRKHPAAPFVKAWMQWRGIDPDRKDNGIMPGALKKAAAIITDPYGEGIGAGDTGFSPHEGQLPIFDEYQGKITVPYALQVFDDSGGESLKAGRGAPLALRLHTEVLLALPYAHRRGKSVPVNVSLQDLVKWAFGPAESFRMSRHFPRIYKALNVVHNMRLAWPGGKWNVVTVRNLPNPEWESRVRMEIELPPGAVSGAQVHRPTLRAYGLDNVGAYRAWLGCCEYWDTFGTHKGRLIHAKRPQVNRNSAGIVTDAQGNALTGRGGLPVRSNWDKRAIPTGKAERNPYADTYPFLNADQVALLVFGPPEKKITRQAIHNRRKRALNTLTAMETDGNLSLEYDGAGGVRILPPAWFRRGEA